VKQVKTLADGMNCNLSLVDLKKLGKVKTMLSVAYTSYIRSKRPASDSSCAWLSWALYVQACIIIFKFQPKIQFF